MRLSIYLDDKTYEKLLKIQEYKSSTEHQRISHPVHYSKSSVIASAIWEFESKIFKKQKN